MSKRTEREERSGLKDLTEAQYLKYFETRLTRLRKSGASVMANCIFHEDSRPSMSVRVDKGIWHCHGCGKGGGILEMEMLIAGDSDAQGAISRIADIVGEPQLKLGSGPEAVYQYRDAQGIPVFQVVRYPSKKFMQRKRLPNGAWEYKTDDLKMVLYNLPEVIQAREVIFVEGEKDADRLMDVLDARKLRPSVAATTAPRGAGKWLDIYSPYLLGKKVVVIPDNDGPDTLDPKSGRIKPGRQGQKHAQRIAESVHPYAYGVKVVELSVGKDVSDYLLSGKTMDDLKEEIRRAELWQPSVKSSIFSGYQAFEEDTPDKIEWLIEGIAERGSNGMLIARPKGGKSVAIIDLAMAMATGKTWLGFYVPQRVRVALISREDNPSTTGHRCRKLRVGRKLSFDDLNDWLFINTRKQTKRLMLDNEEEVAELIRDLIKHKCEVAILDVMRVLHDEDENSNTDMQGVINSLNRIRDATGVTLILVHHSKKGEDEASLTEMARGASAIAGWCEWIAGISVVDKKEWVRSMEIELKGAESPALFFWKMHDVFGQPATPSKPAVPHAVELRQMPSDYKPPQKRQDRRGKKKAEPEEGAAETAPADRDAGSDDDNENYSPF